MRKQGVIQTIQVFQHEMMKLSRKKKQKNAAPLYTARQKEVNTKEDEREECLKNVL